MAHAYPPEDPRSAASTVAPFQPAARVVADDVPDEQNPAGGPHYHEVAEEFADKPHPSLATGPGPDRAPFPNAASALRNADDEELARFADRAPETVQAERKAMEEQGDDEEGTPITALKVDPQRGEATAVPADSSPSKASDTGDSKQAKASSKQSSKD